MVTIPSSARRLYRRARLQRLLGRPQRTAELCHAALQTADYSMAHLKAHQMLAELEFPGEDYFRVLARIHEHLKPATYLEIGVDQGHSFEIVRPETLRWESIRTHTCKSLWGPVSGCSHRPATNFLSSAM